MTANPLIIARRLAIHLLHEAQIAAPAAICGVVVCDANGEPQRYLADTDAATAKFPKALIWAKVYSKPSAPAIPSAADMHVSLLTLVISLNTKGVLEMRAWLPENGAPVERVVTICE